MLHAAQLFTELPGVDRRAARRRAVDLEALARDAGSPVLSVHVSDLSSLGCRIVSDVPLEPGTRIWLKLPGIPAKRARISWVEDRDAGCTFSTPLDQVILDDLTAASHHALRPFDLAPGRSVN